MLLLRRENTGEPYGTKRLREPEAPAFRKRRERGDTMMPTRNISIKNLILAAFATLMLVTGGIAGFIVFSGWTSSAEESAARMAEEINDAIVDRVNAHFNIPLHIITVYRELLERGVVDMNSPAERERFMVSVMRAHGSGVVYSFGYATEEGEYYAVRWNPGGEPEILRNSAETGGNSWYYSVADDMTAGEFVLDAGAFDPRTRNWYIAARGADGPLFSPVYKHFVMPDLAVSASCPILGGDGGLRGVLSAHVTLSKINGSLEEAVRLKHGVAAVVEKRSGAFVANSTGQPNFVALPDGSVRRLSAEDAEIAVLKAAYAEYLRTGGRSMKTEDEGGAYFARMQEYRLDGLELLILSAIPESLFTSGVFKSMRLALWLIILLVLAAIAIYRALANAFMRPVEELIEATERFAGGDLSRRAVVVRDDEIGSLARSFNAMADKLHLLVGTLESKVKERTAKLEQTNAALNESEERLRLILDSTAEAIYGIDAEGRCTFANASCLKTLGYGRQEELLGRNMHALIHHSHRDGRPIRQDECRIFQVLAMGESAFADDEVFWRADGTCFEVEYSVYPQYKGGELVGAVVAFMDNTERRKSRARIDFLTYNDALTGLYNRMYFERALKTLDGEEHLPVAVIFGDVNGLKLTNDIFGHAAGDELLKKAAEILKRACRESDVVARVGGDEFAVVLPRTGPEVAEKVVDRIRREFAKERILAIKASISMGYAAKTRPEENLEVTVKDAEDAMYKVKTLDRKTVAAEMVRTILETLYSRSPQERRHSLAVGAMCADIGRALRLPEPETRRLREMGLLHDIGKIAVDEAVLNKNGTYAREERQNIEQHPAVGYRILNLFDETIDLAEAVLYHHENWDGSGYPVGVRGEEIPRQARILRIAETYDALTGAFGSSSMSDEEALEEIERHSGSMFDPEIVKVFVGMMSGKK